MPVATRLKFWILALLLVCYIVGVVVLSAVSLHGFKRDGFARPLGGIGNTLIYQQRRQTPRRIKTSFDYGSSVFRPVLKHSKIQWCSQLRYVPNGDFNDRKPIALVSFPGSGNTWLRYLLQQATGYLTGSIYKDYGLLKNGFPAESVSNASVLVVKTHEWGPKARDMFSKAVLLVRAPDQSIQAEFNRQSGGHIGFASADRYRRNNGKYWHLFVADNIRGWYQLNMDWLLNFNGPIHVILYDRLVDNTEHTLRTVINFLDVYAPLKRFQCAIDRKEGIYRRRKRLLNFDPFTPEMRARINAVQKKVYDVVYAKTEPEKRQR